MFQRYTRQQFWSLPSSKRALALAEWLQTNTIRGGLDPTFDQISASTLADMREDVVYDNLFVDGAWQRLFRSQASVDDYLGGTIMQVPFMYDRVLGGAIAPASDVVVTQKQILAALGFVPKEYIEQVPLNLWQTNVINAGPAGKVSLTDMYMTNAVMAFSTDVNIDFYRHGQAASTGVNDNRAIYINGAAEACNDGVNPGWDGNYFTTYGGQTRNGAVTNTLNSVPIWAGDTVGNPGQTSYKLLLEAYFNCVQEPGEGLTNKALFAYLLERQEPKQRFGQETDARIGLTGIKVMNAFIHLDKLAPSTKYGTILPSGLSNTTSIKPATFTLPSLTTAQVAISGYPASATPTITPGEIFWWFRLKDWKVRPSPDPEYAHNFTPPIRSQTNADLIVMFYKNALNVYTPSPRDNWQVLGCGF